jgi:hypothetical protein
MRFCLLFLLLILFAFNTYAQKKGIEKLSKHKIDSLRNKHIDTILWYHSYCGECFIKKNDNPIKYANCTVQSGYDLTYNAIIYKQKDKYFILNFDCNNLLIKRQLDSCKSIPYFISIMSILNSRDKTIKEIYRKGGFLGPLQSDGGFEDADIYYHNIKQHITMTSTEATDEVYKQYFWIGKEIKLFRLISGDIVIKKP